MRRHKNILPWALFGVVLIAGLIIYTNTYGGKRYPAQLTEEEAYNMLINEEDVSAYLVEGTTGFEDAVNIVAAGAAEGTYYAAEGVKGFFQRLFNPGALEDEIDYLVKNNGKTNLHK